MKKTYLILPGCDDSNRGDQALIWETVRIVKEAGYCGDYYMVASESVSNQSKLQGINNIEPILPHPSVHFKKNNNIHYGRFLKLKWAFVSVWDCLKSIVLLNKMCRKLFLRFYPDSIKKSMDVYSKVDKAFIKGGGFIHSYGGAVSTYTVFYNLYPVILAQKMGIDVYVMPNSFGPIKGLVSRKLVKEVMKKCKSVTARESISCNYLKEELGVYSELFPDLAFYLQEDSEMNDKQLEKVGRLPKDKKCVAITMRPYRFPNSENPQKDYARYKQNLCEFIKYLSNKGFYPVLVEHTYSPVEHEQDMSCIKDVAELLDNSCNYSIYSDLTLNCRQLKYVYSKFDYIVGTRFHSVIFSIASGVPAIAITYGGNKGQGIMNDIGLSEFAIDISDMNFDSLLNSFQLLVSKEDEVKNKISSFIKALPQKRQKLVELME